jgi:drug/metabolite transporter (DMT)-like permease
MTDNLRGALWMMLAMLAFAVEDALIKRALLGGGITPGMAMVLFGLMAMALSAFYARAQGVGVWHPAYLQPRLLVRTALEIFGRLFFALSLAYNTLTVTTTILQAAPLVVTLGAALILKERVQARRWLAMGVGLVGVLLVLRPVPEQFSPTAIFALLGMLGFAGRDLATRASPPAVHAAQLGVLGFAVVTVAGAILLVFQPQPLALPVPGSIAAMALTALAGVLAYTALTFAMRTGDVSAVAPFRYIRLVAALAIAVVVFDERPDLMTLAGAALIVGSGLYTLWRERRVRSLSRPS